MPRRCPLLAEVQGRAATARLEGAGRRIPENPAWTRPGLTAGPGFRVSPGFRPGFAARVAHFRHRGTGRALRRRRLAETSRPPATLIRPAKVAVPASAGDAPMRRTVLVARARRGARAPTLGRGPGWPCATATTAVGAPAALCARAPPDRGGGRRMCSVRAVLPPSSGPPHPDPPPAAVISARSGAEHMLR
jgi:hypothetical protein